MNIFSGIGHFFKSLFGKNSDVAQKVLHDVSSFVSLAEPIVQEVETEVKAINAVDPSATLAATVKFLGKYEPDLAKVQTTASSLVGLPTTDLWHSLATIALGTVVPSGTAGSLINLAVELAYNFVKSKSAAEATPAPAAAATPAKAA